MPEIIKIEKTMYKSAITDKTFETYEEAYRHDC